MTRTRARFHYGIFSCAVRGLLDREPDSPVVRAGYDGFYHMVFVPKNDAQRAEFIEHAYTIRKWMDEYDLVFSDCRCEFGPSRTGLKDGKDVLEIIIQHPKDFEEEMLRLTRLSRG